jgi:hypothetical protein
VPPGTDSANTRTSEIPALAARVRDSAGPAKCVHGAARSTAIGPEQMTREGYHLAWGRRLFSPSPGENHVPTEACFFYWTRSS